MLLQFDVSYDLCSRYKSSEAGEFLLYKIREGVHLDNHGSETLPAILMTVGTVMNEYRGHGEFPPDEVVKKLSDTRNGIRYFAARWDEKYEKVFYKIDGSEISSDYFRPAVIQQGNTFWYKPYFDMMP